MNETTIQQIERELMSMLPEKPLSEIYSKVMDFDNKAMRVPSGFQMIEKDGVIRFVDMSEVYK